MSDISENTMRTLKSMRHTVGDDIGTEGDLNQTIDILIKVYIQEHNRQLRLRQAEFKGLELLEESE